MAYLPRNTECHSVNGGAAVAPVISTSLWLPGTVRTSGGHIEEPGMIAPRFSSILS